MLGKGTNHPCAEQRQTSPHPVEEAEGSRPIPTASLTAKSPTLIILLTKTLHQRQVCKIREHLVPVTKNILEGEAIREERSSSAPSQTSRHPR